MRSQDSSLNAFSNKYIFIYLYNIIMTQHRFDLFKNKCVIFLNETYNIEIVISFVLINK